MDGPFLFGAVNEDFNTCSNLLCRLLCDFLYPARNVIEWIQSITYVEVLITWMFIVQWRSFD